MKIKELDINRYKSIEDPIIVKNFSNLHILVGPNNAGKTNVLDAINLFFNPNLDKERFLDEKSSVKMILNFENEDHILESTFSLLENNKEIYSKIQQHFIRIEDTSSIYHLFPEKLKEFKNFHPKEYREFSFSLKEYFKDIEISEELFILSIEAEKKKIRPLRRMGEGFKRLFVILFYFFHPQYQLILIDEPELHLHPSIIKKLLFILSEKNTKNQIFLTTHHPTFIQAKYLNHVWRISKNNNQSTVIHGFSEFGLDINRFIQEINDDNSSMLFSDKVLLVEGVSDHIFMREIIDRFYTKEKDIKVVYTGGKGTVDLYARLCKIFNIPYAAMLDGDALHSSSLMKIKDFSFLKRKISDEAKIRKLKEKEIFILEKDLEYTYPKRYKKRETKPLNALFVSTKINYSDINSFRMKIIKDIIDKI